MKFSLILVSIVITAIVGCNTASPIKAITVLSGGWENSKATVVRLNEIAKEYGLILKVKEIIITNVNDAVRYGMFGSPSVQINGIDIDPTVRGLKETGFTWRIYDGVSGIPSKKLILQAFKEANWIK